MQLADTLSRQYLRFAEAEAHGRSPLYENLARNIATDENTIDFLITLPQEKRQPNLLLAAVRHLFGTPRNWSHFRTNLLANTETVRAFMLTHATQTNEPARCATLLPILAQLPQPLALIEVGASAGLCLLPDHYGYDYGGQPILPERTGTKHPIFTCTTNTTTPLPKTMPRIAWRAGLDLNPIDAANPSQTAWLHTLVWPEQTTRLANLKAALDIAAAHKPNIVKADLQGNALADLCREAPTNATRVIFHTAVVAYVEDANERQAFADRAISLCDYWISNESSGVFPDIARRAERPGKPGQFLLSVNAIPIAWTDPHGSTLDWIATNSWRTPNPKAR